jgi:hypothetical protein
MDEAAPSQAGFPPVAESSQARFPALTESPQVRLSYEWFMPNKKEVVRHRRADSLIFDFN